MPAVPEGFQRVYAEADLEVFAARLDDPCLAREELLDPEEQAGLERRSLPAPRRHFLASHAARRLLLGAWMGRPAAALSFEAGQYGKPRLLGEEGRRFRFNVSHSDERFLIAVSRKRRLGLDIEMIARDVDYLGIGRSVFTGDEQVALAAAQGTARRALFFRLWTRKEALMKASGEGFQRPPRSFEIPVALRGPRPDGLMDYAGGRWRLVGLDVGADSDAAIALAV